MFLSGKFDGILGLSFPSLSASGYTPVFDNIIDQKLLTHNQFSFYYSPLPEQNSAFILGEPARDLYTGEIDYVDVSREFYWELNLHDILVDGKPMNFCPDGPCKIVVDTGTSLLTGPSSHVTRLLQEVDIEEDCSAFSSLPDLT